VEEFSALPNRAFRVLSLVVALSSAVGGQTVSSNYLPGVDFSKYRTYSWAETAPHPDQNVDATIKALIDSQLQSKGLTKTDSKPDLSVAYRVAMTRREEWPKFRYNELSDGGVITVYAGTLEFTMNDLALHQAVWSGRATKAVDPNATAARKQKNLDKAIQQLLKSYPH
jgi:hypothetical protein